MWRCAGADEYGNGDVDGNECSDSHLDGDENADEHANEYACATDQYIDAANQHTCPAD